MIIHIKRESELWPPDIKEIAHETGLRVCKAINWQWDCEVSLCLVNDVQIKELNAIWRRRLEPTDVLSFPQFERKELALLKDQLQHKVIVWGDVVISWDTLQRQAKAQRKDWQFRFKELWVHGLLHLLGYDHEKDAKMAEEMYAIEDNIMAQES